MDLVGIHHDGSDLYVSHDSPEFGEVVQVRLRVWDQLGIDRVSVRSVLDGEAQLFHASITHEANGDVWWQADLPIRNVVQHYRWFVKGEAIEYGWLNAAGFFPHDVTDASDFSISVSSPTPEWLKRAQVYQIFPDRFAKSDREYEKPSWLVQRDWSQLPEGRSANTAYEWFGGDLWGAAEKLDYLQTLGVNTVYFTPFFPARSTHRYDAHSFESVDELLGGDDALKYFVEQAHKRGMRVIGDITLNHCGVTHEWFVKAQAGEHPYREFFTFDEKLPQGYECWLGVRTLPKFNFNSEELIKRFITDDKSIIRKWLRTPFGLDGWRVDVANMAGRQGEFDLTRDIAKIVRAVVREEGEDKVLIAEHFHDAGPDLQGHGWHGTMNYSAFQRPILGWLAGKEYREETLQHPVPMPHYSGQHMVTSIEAFSARMPWRSRINSWPTLGSHDTARTATVINDDTNLKIAVTLLCTLPGAPMIFMGDELGAVGHWGEQARTPMPWDAVENQRPALLDFYTEVLHLRSSHEALTSGSLRWISIAENAVVFIRETKSETLLICAARTTDSVNLPNWCLANTDLESIHGSAVLHSREIVIDQPGVTIWRAQ
ncbi:MAG: hypothetical protein RIS75_1187 [Actinomycetota bacterium]